MSRAQAHHQPCPCGAELADECPRCASINPLGSMRIVQPYRPGDEADLAPVHDAALPKGAPGAWIREAVERLFTPPEHEGWGDAGREVLTDAEIGRLDDEGDVQ